MKKYILPKSIFVNQRTVADRERGTIANYGVDLEQLIVNTIANATPPIYSADNGLTLNGLVFELGGTLIQNTTIDGAGSSYSLTLQDLTDFDIVANTMDINADLYLDIPSIATASNGYVLTLADDTTGLAEWAAVPAATVVDADNGLSLVGTTVVLGGDLNASTGIDGLNLHGMQWDNLQGYYVNTTIASITASTSLLLETPNVTATTAVNGQVLTLLNQNTGECEWSDASVINAESGLNLSSGIVRLGGLLTQNATINGDSYTYRLLMQNLNIGTLEANTLNLTGNTLVTLTTPTTASNFADTSVLTLDNNLNGECNWAPNNVRKTVLVDSATYAQTEHDYYIFCDPDTAGGAITITLLNPASYPGKKVVIKQTTAGTTSSASITFPGAGPIYTSSAQPSIGTVAAGDVVKLVSDGVYWQQI